MTEPGPLFCCTVITPQHICLSIERAGLLIVCKCPNCMNYTLESNQCVSQLGSKDTKSQGRAEILLLGFKPVFLAPSLVPSHVPLWQLPGTAGLGTALGRSVSQAGKGDAMALCSHLTGLWCIRQDGGKQWCWKWQLGVLVSKRDYSLSVNPFPFKLSWNGTLVAGHYRSSWKVCVFLAKCVCVPAKASCCCLLLLNPSVCDGFQGHPNAVSFTGFSLWHRVLNLCPVFCEAACCCEKGKAMFVVSPQALFPSHVHRTVMLLENISSLFPLCCLSLTETQQRFLTKWEMQVF